MKKVLLSAYACSPIRGSETSNGWSWAIGLAEKGYNVWCLTNVEDQSEAESERLKLKLENLHFVFISLPLNLDKHLLDNSSKTVYLHYFLWKKKATNIALNLHEAHHFDVAHHVTYGSFQQGSCLYKLDDCKIIFGPVGGGQMALPVLKPYFESSWPTEVIRGFISKMLMKYSTSLNQTLRKAHTVLTINKETEDLLKTSKHFRVGQNYMVSDAAISKKYEKMEFVERPPHDELRIIWIGRLIPRKGINLSLKALSYLPDNLPYKLTIVGGGEQEKYLDGWIKEYGLDESKIERLGWIPFNEVAEEYKKADVMLFCSLRDTAGNQVIEAMTYGLPVIVLNISGMVNIVPANSGLKINPTTTEGTAKDIAEALKKMFHDPIYRREAGFNAYKRAMENTWKNKIELVTSKFY